MLIHEQIKKEHNTDTIKKGIHDVKLLKNVDTVAPNG